MMNTALIKLKTGLIVVFVLTLLAILIQLCYVFWRRRLFKRRHFSGAESDITTSTATTGGNYPSYTITSPSKELLYFLCWKNQSRIEPTFRSSTDHEEPAETTSVADEFKLHEVLYGPSRVLFTIKEEKDEEFEYYDHQNKSGSNDDDLMIKDKKRISLEECFDDQRSTGGEVIDDDQATSMVKIMINDDDDDDEEGERGQFSTPCGSPPYYTPTPSPSRDDDNGNLAQIDGGVLVVDDHLERESRKANNKERFVSCV